MLKDQLFKTSGLQFDNWLFGPEIEKQALGNALDKCKLDLRQNEGCQRRQS